MKALMFIGLVLMSFLFKDEIISGYVIGAALMMAGLLAREDYDAGPAVVAPLVIALMANDVGEATAIAIPTTCLVVDRLLMRHITYVRMYLSAWVVYLIAALSGYQDVALGLVSGAVVTSIFYISLLAHYERAREIVRRVRHDNSSH